MDPRQVRDFPGVGAAPSTDDTPDYSSHDGRDSLSLRENPQRFFSATGHRRAHRGYSRRPGYFIPDDARPSPAISGHGNGRSCGGYFGGLHRRQLRNRKYREDVRDTPAFGRAQDQRGSLYQTVAQE